jgi:hypothetical protein
MSSRLLFVICCCCLGGRASANQIVHVASTGGTAGATGVDGPGCGPSVTPCATLAFAVQNRSSSSEATTFILAAGVHTLGSTVGAGGIPLPSQVQPVTIAGVSIGGDERWSQTPVDCGSARRAFDVGAGTERVVIANLTLANCVAPVGQDGGAVRTSSVSTTISSVRFVSNSAAIGGAVAVMGGSLNIDGCLLERHSATNSGGGALCVDAGKVEVTNSTFKSNTVVGPGGAVWLYSGHTTFTECTFRGNAAPNSGGGGGAVSVQGSGTVAEFNGSTFESNTAPGGGGAALLLGGHTTFTECTLRGNAAQNR